MATGPLPLDLGSVLVAREKIPRLCGGRDQWAAGPPLTMNRGTPINGVGAAFEGVDHDGYGLAKHFADQALQQARAEFEIDVELD